MHHQAGVNFENLTEVKFRDILLTGTGHQTFEPGQSRPNRDVYGRHGVIVIVNRNRLQSITVF